MTSKHSVGGNETVRTESGLSHAQMGESWLARHLEKAGKAREQLAKVLWSENLTAVAEASRFFVPEGTELTIQRISYVTTRSKSMCLRTLPSRLVSTCTV